MALYFRGFVLAMMLLGQSRKCVTNVARVCFFLNRHISNWERFLSQTQWDMGQIQRRLISPIREKMGEKLLVHGAYLGWVDTTLIPKVQGKMPGVQKWHDHSGNPDRGTHLVRAPLGVVRTDGGHGAGQEVDPGVLAAAGQPDSRTDQPLWVCGQPRGCSTGHDLLGCGLPVDSQSPCWRNNRCAWWPIGLSTGSSFRGFFKLPRQKGTFEIRGLSPRKSFD